VDVGVLEPEARELNRGFITWAEKGRPLVTLKLAASLDGRIATRGGDSKWITGLPARKEAHRLRAEHDAVVVGGATVLADDPELTVRHVRGPHPARIVLDPRLSTSPRARWLADDGTRRIVVGSPAATAGRRRLFEKAGAEVWIVTAGRGGGIQLGAFARKAAASGLLSLLVEGGGRLAGAFLVHGLVDRLRLFTAPLLLGGDGRGWTAGLRAHRVADGLRLKESRVTRLGEDWLVQGDV
jgi:diaminohydroxyphosphoribosylaminopyrimidine deaminase/5-amino-6-(5-phosphoribosylamino)uracil reductase